MSEDSLVISGEQLERLNNRHLIFIYGKYLEKLILKKQGCFDWKWNEFEGLCSMWCAEKRRLICYCKLVHVFWKTQKTLSTISMKVTDKYNVYAFIPEWKKALLSQRGLKLAENGEIKIWVCASWHGSLNSGEDDGEKNPPKFSIANDLTICNLSLNLGDVTITERKLTSLASFREYTVISRGGKHKFIKIHILVFDCSKKN